MQTDIWKSRSEIFLNVVKCLGIGAAGYWALFKFNITEAPNYAPTLALSSDVFQENWNVAGACRFQLRIQIANNFNTPVKIDGVHVKLWLFEFPQPEKPVKFVDFREFETKPTTPTTWELPAGADKPLSFEYYPHQQASYDYDLLFLNPDKHYVYYKVTLDSKTSEIAGNVFDTKYVHLRC